jgi:hypothetical protein
MGTGVPRGTLRHVQAKENPGNDRGASMFHVEHWHSFGDSGTDLVTVTKPEPLENGHKIVAKIRKISTSEGFLVGGFAIFRRSLQIIGLQAFGD